MIPPTTKFILFLIAKNRSIHHAEIYGKIIELCEKDV